MIADLAIAAVVTAAALGAVWSAWAYAVRQPRPARPRPLVYIAAPFDPCDGLDAAENTRRAVVLATIYKRRGFEVVCPHPALLAGRTDDGHTVRACRDVAGRGGRIAVLHRSDRTMSDENRSELRAFLANGGVGKVDCWHWNPDTNSPERSA